MVRDVYDGVFLYDSCIYHSAQNGIRGSVRRLGVYDLRNHIYRRHTIVLHGHYGSVYSQDLYGVETAASFYYSGNKQREC